MKSELSEYCGESGLIYDFRAFRKWPRIVCSRGVSGSPTGFAFLFSSVLIVVSNSSNLLFTICFHQLLQLGGFGIFSCTFLLTRFIFIATVPASAVT